VIAETDTKSKDMCLQKLKDWNGWKQDDQFYYIPRSREVYQSFFTSIFSTLKAFIYSVMVTIPTIKPDLVSALKERFNIRLDSGKWTRNMCTDMCSCLYSKSKLIKEISKATSFLVKM
jgi:hypothetical protein